MLERAKAGAFLKAPEGMVPSGAFSFLGRRRQEKQMSTNLLQANREWATRPADQRFWSLDDLHQKAETRRHEARVATVASRDLVVVATEDSDLRLLGKAGIESRLTNYSFCQLAGPAGVPGGYLASLPAELAARNLNHGLEQRAERDKPLYGRKLLAFPNQEATEPVLLLT
jgi:hypothetical protein